jgi:endonuclease YncB( thermonuclease family)
MVHGKQVQVVQKDMNRYGRVVDMVFIGKTCINQEIVRAGLA